MSTSPIRRRRHAGQDVAFAELPDPAAPAGTGAAAAERAQRRTRELVESVTPRAACHQTIERSLHILEYLWASQMPVRLSQISQALDLGRSTALRILQSLEMLGYVHRDPDDKSYVLGYMSQRLGSRRELMATNAHHAEPFLRRLALELGDNVTIGSLEGVNVVFHCCIAPPSRPRALVDVGAAYDAHASATGRMLLANLPEEELGRLYRHCHLTRHTSHTLVSFRMLVRELRRCWTRRYAVELGESSTALGSVAVPIVNPRGMSNVAIGIVAPVDRLGEARVPYIVERCRALARELYDYVIRERQ